MRLFTSESVTPGHPDKLCDQISDAILDAYLEQDPDSRVAVEVMATAGGLVIGGEVRSSARVDRRAVAQRVIRTVGHTRYALLPVLDFVALQSAEIAAGVDSSYEQRHAEADAPFDPIDEQGAGDQGLMFGYAVDETPDLMPLPISLAHALARRLYNLGAEDDFAALGPDGKTQVTVGYDDAGRPARVHSVLISTQHAERLRSAPLRRMMIRDVIKPVLEQYGYGSPESILVNPSGRFTVGGPEADAGLTGRKIIVDTYGGAARHGGGAFSGKDPSKVDRSAAYAMRWVAKHVVSAGLASRCEVQVAYAIGSAHPVGLYVETFGTGVASDEAIARAVSAVFDLRPAAIIRDLDLLRPIYAPTAAFGHFGAPSFSARLERPWEQLSPTRIAGLQLALSGATLSTFPPVGPGFTVRGL
jgi:S-adenosylmethionine synthetase